MDGGGAVAAALAAVHDQDEHDVKEQAANVTDVLETLRKETKSEVFRMLDKNADGVISLNELTGKGPASPKHGPAINQEDLNIKGALVRTVEGNSEVMPGAHVMKVLDEVIDDHRAKLFNYIRLFVFLLYVALYLAILFLQRDTSKAFEIEEAIKGGVFSEVTNTIEQSSGEIVVNMDGADHIYEWFHRHVVEKVFTEPVCGDGQCDEPQEFPQWGTYGCSSDCGWYPQEKMTEVNIRIQPEFSTEAELNTAWWNLCSPTHEICLFTSNKKFSSFNDTQDTTISLPDGDWYVRLFASDGNIEGKVFEKEVVFVETTTNTSTSTNSTTNSTSTTNVTTEVTVTRTEVEKTIVSWERCQAQVSANEQLVRSTVIGSCFNATGIEPKFCGPDEYCPYCATEEVCLQQQGCAFHSEDGCIQAACGPHSRCEYCSMQGGCGSQEGCRWSDGECSRDPTLCDSNTCAGETCFLEACKLAGCDIKVDTMECVMPCQDMECDQCFGSPQDCNSKAGCVFEAMRCEFDCSFDTCDSDPGCAKEKPCNDVGCNWNQDSQVCEVGSPPPGGGGGGGGTCSGTDCTACDVDQCSFATCSVMNNACVPKCNPNSCDTEGCNSPENCEFHDTCWWNLGACEPSARRRLQDCNPNLPCSMCHDKDACSGITGCLWDGGYCTDQLEYEVSECGVASEGRCSEDYQIGNGRCDSQCNIPECSYDGGDCEDTAMWLSYQCSPRCYCNLLGDGECDPACDTPACGSDMGDCCNRLFRGQHNLKFSLYNHNTTAVIDRLTPDPTIPRARYMAGANRILGGVLLTAKRRKAGDCGAFSKYYDRCFNDTGGEETRPYGADPVFLPSSDLYNPSLSKSDFYDINDPNQVSPMGTPYGFQYVNIEGFEEVAGYPMFFDINLSEKRANDYFLYAKQGFYLDSTTESMTMQVVTFNGHHKLFASVITVFDFEQGGRISMTYDVQTLRVDLDNVFRERLEYLFFILTLVNLGGEFAEAIFSKCLTGKWLGHFKSVWNYLEILSISLFIYLAFSWRYYVNLAENYNPELRYNVFKSLDLEAKFLDIQKNELREMLTVFAETQKLSDAIASYLSYTGLVLITLILRLLRVLDFQKRMGVVTRTVKNASADLAHFAVLFALVFGLYATMGHLIFGASVIGFSSMWKSMNTCFAILLGEIGVTEELFNLPNSTPAILFYYTYIFVVFFILLNVLLAILVEAYVEVKSAAEGSESLPKELINVCSSNLRKVPGWKLSKKEYMSDNQMQEVMKAYLYRNDLVANKTKIGRRVANIQGFRANFEELKECIAEQLREVTSETIPDAVENNAKLSRHHTKHKIQLKKLQDVSELEAIAEKIAANFVHRFGEGKDIVGVGGSNGKSRRKVYKVGPESNE